MEQEIHDDFLSLYDFPEEHFHLFPLNLRTPDLPGNFTSAGKSG